MNVTGISEVDSELGLALKWRDNGDPLAETAHFLNAARFLLEEDLLRGLRDATIQNFLDFVLENWRA